MCCLANIPTVVELESCRDIEIISEFLKQVSVGLKISVAVLNYQKTQ